MDPIQISQTEIIARLADVVWATLARLNGAAMPAFMRASNIASTPTTSAQSDQRIQLSDSMMIEQRVVERDDATMRLVFEMTQSQGVPWSSYRSVFQIEPIDAATCRVSIICDATPTTEQRLVEAMLRDLYRLSLEQLKAHVEQ